MLRLKPISSLSADPLEPKRLHIVIATIVINVVAVALLVFAPWSNWRTGLALNLFDNVLLLSFVLLHRDGLLAPTPGELAVDCTLGHGGHAQEILAKILPGGKLLGLDADPVELPKTEARLRALGF